MAKYSIHKDAIVRTVVAIAVATLTINASTTLAAQRLREVDSGNPGFPEKYEIDLIKSYNSGVEALNEGDYRRAERRFHEVLSISPKLPAANFYMGLAKVGLNKDKAAIGYFEIAIEERPNFVEARSKLALVNIRMGDSESARVQLAALRDIREDCTGGSCDSVMLERISQSIDEVEDALGETSEDVYEPLGNAAVSADY